MFFHLLGVFAQWEREEITERVNASVLTRAKLGKSINGSAPYGYQWKDRKLVIKPEEAVIRKKAYELFLQHRRKSGRIDRSLPAGDASFGRCFGQKLATPSADTKTRPANHQDGCNPKGECHIVFARADD